MSRRKQQMMEEADGPGWITTYADLMTLLLVFFVLLFSISTIEREAFEETARSLNIALSREANSLIPLPERAPETTRIPEVEEHIVQYPTDAQLADQMRFQQALIDAANLELQEMVSELQDSLATTEAGSWVEIGSPKDGKLTLRVSGAVLFEAGSAEISRAMMPMLDSVLEIILANPGFKLEIQGHTDDIPISTVQFPSNWELSAVRATSVLRFLVDGGLPPTRVSATGYGDSMPLVPNSSEANRATNRRIEFVLERMELPRL